MQTETGGLMTTQCIPLQLEFHGANRRDVIGRFDGGQISSDGGGLLLREVEQRTGVLRRLARAFTDYRHPDWIEHSVLELVSRNGSTGWRWATRI